MSAQEYCCRCVVTPCSLLDVDVFGSLSYDDDDNNNNNNNNRNITDNIFYHMCDLVNNTMGENLTTGIRTFDLQSS